jgi:tetratricopeptide (TPR) repeat protein
MLLAALVPALLLATIPPASSATQRLLGSLPADSLPAPLSRLEATGRGGDAAEAALALGRLHYARGEYRQAAGDFVRATPRFDPARRGEARYWTGLSWLGAGEVARARAAFEEAARGDSPRRADALLGTAFCWEAARQPARALETLQTLLAGDPGEAGPAALEREAALASQLGRPELARRARERLAREYPRSVEAVRAARPAPGPASAPRPARPASAPPSSAPHVAPPPTAAQVPMAVQIGVFRDEARARELAELARHRGFGPVRVPVLQDRGGALYAVRVGVYATAGDARSAGERLGRALAVAWRVVPAP